MEMLDTFQLVCDTVIGYAFWSLVHGLGPLIWFYPLNELDITGYEAFVLVAFSPLLLLFGRTITSVLKSNLLSHLLLLLMLGGCASFQSKTLLSRLVILSVGVAASFLIQNSLWWSNDIKKRKISFWGFTLGFMTLLSSRIWYVSFTPLWNDYTSNKVIVTIFAIAIGTKMLFKQPASGDQSSDAQQGKKPLTGNMPCSSASLGYGALFFLIYAIYGEVSIVSRFTVQGFPSTGPAPNPWGGLILIMLTLGLVLSMHSNLVTSYVWSLCGFLSSLGLMFLPTWTGFFSGAFFATYLMSVWPTVSQNMVNCNNPGKSLIIANATYLLGVFGMVWCTAYNFVPFGGGLARERTYIIVVIMTLLVVWSIIRNTGNPGAITKFVISTSLPETNYYVKTPDSSKKVKTADDDFGKTVKNLLFFIALVGILGFQFRKLAIPSRNPTVITDNNKGPSTKKFSALIWTFHFGYDNQGWPSMERAADLLNKTGADVITLLESDASKPYLGNNDIAMWLGEKLKMYVDFGPSTRDHTWGNLILSKYPIVKSEHHLLPSPHGELAPAISATVNISGSLVDFVVTHMGNDRDDLDRKLQAEALSRLCDDASNPVVFLGYVTSKPGSRDYMQLLNRGRMKDIDSSDQHRWCEYIMYRGLIKLGYARISHGGLSDTELQMGRWQIDTTKKKSLKDRYKSTLSDESIPEALRFCSDFGGHYGGHWHGSGHHYHMNTPKYFIP